jgi:hypothetical protein
MRLFSAKAPWKGTGPGWFSGLRIRLRGGTRAFFPGMHPLGGLIRDFTAELADRRDNTHSNRRPWQWSGRVRSGPEHLGQ